MDRDKEITILPQELGDMSKEITAFKEKLTSDDLV